MPPSPHPNRKLTIAAVLPACNEEALVEHTVTDIAAALRGLVPWFDFVGTDDGSRDHMGTILARLVSTRPDLHLGVVTHPPYVVDDLMEHTLSPLCLLTAAVLAFVAVSRGASRPGVKPTSVAVTVAPATPQPTAAIAQVVPVAVAQLTLNPQPASQSSQVHVSRKGLPASETVMIVTDQLPLETATSNASGNFAAVPVTRPDQLQSGSHPLDSVGQTSVQDTIATLWIRAPQLWLVADPDGNPLPAYRAAQFNVHWSHVPVNGETTCPMFSSLTVTAPNEYCPLTIPVQIRACGGGGGRLDVSPVEQWRG
jgi:hypothetical protein